MLFWLTELIRRFRWRRKRLDPERLRREEDLRASLLRRLLVAAVAATLIYLVFGALGFGASRLFPYDAIEMLAAICLSGWLVANGKVHQATIWLLVIMSHPLSFQIATHGVGSPAGALLLPTIVVCGLLVGRSLLALWAWICCDIVLWLAWVQSRGETTNGSAAASFTSLLPVVLGWWALFAVTAWLVGLFAANLERLLQVTRRQADTRTRLLDVLVRTPDVQEVLEPVAEVIREQLQAAEICLWRLEEDKETLRCLVNTPTGSRLKYTETVRAADAKMWARLAQDSSAVSLEGAEIQQARCFLAAAGITEALLVPLSLGGMPVGLLAAGFAEPDAHPPERLEVAQAAGELASLCMEMTRLAALDRHAAVLAERNRMAHEIHDTLAQGFTGVLLQIAAAEEMMSTDNTLAQRHLDTARTLAKSCLDEARRSVWALRPRTLEKSDLPTSLAELARQLSSGGRSAIHVEVTGTPYALPPQTESDLLRIGQEAMTNAVRHAGPCKVAVRLTYAPGRFRLAVEDSGVTPWDAQATKSAGLGLSGMRERAQRIGGTLTVESAAGEGTHVSIEVTV